MLEKIKNFGKIIFGLNFRFSASAANALEGKDTSGAFSTTSIFYRQANLLTA